MLGFKCSSTYAGFGVTTNLTWYDDRKSTAGYVFSLGSGPVTWACKKQQALALSLAEVEYRATVNVSKEALWLRHIL